MEEENRKEIEELEKACMILEENDMKCSKFFSVTEAYRMLAARIGYLYDCLGEYDLAKL